MLAEFLKYNTVGIINTAVGFSIVFTLMYLGISPTQSNIVGYGIGAILSYWLNSRYTFKMSEKKGSHLIKFFLALGIAYLVNLLVLHYALLAYNPYLAQVLSAISYTGSAFIMMKVFVFRN